MGETASTQYFATDGGAAIGAALSELLTLESHPVEGRTQVGWWRRGAPGWTVVETFPPWLLLDRPPGSTEPRLATLTRRLGVSALHLSVHDGAEVLLVESDREGRWAATGAGDLSAGPPSDRLDPRAARDGTVPRFLIVSATPPMQAAITRSGPGAVSAMSAVLGGKRSPRPFDVDYDEGATPIFYASNRGAGGRVHHTRFGEGTILDELGGDPAKLSIAFDDGTRRVLLARFVERR